MNFFRISWEKSRIKRDRFTTESNSFVESEKYPIWFLRQILFSVFFLKLLNLLSFHNTRVEPGHPRFENKVRRNVNMVHH